MKNLRIWTLLLTAILLSSCTTQEIVIEKEIIKTGKEGSGSELLTTFEPVESSILDNGRMWTFEYAPREYFEETYNFEATDAWFERARLSSVRLPNCSGSFISPDGLVMTNHHCAREMVSAVSQEGEDLLVDGFYAETMEDERPIPDYYLDQLVEIRDVTDEILDVVDAAPAEEQAAVREQKISEVQQALTAEFEADGDKSVQVVSLFNGGRYSAYIFRRFTDVRMVMAPELQIGYYGGDADNFTYPRYNLDMSFYRVYVDGQPYQPEHFFPFSSEGVEEGDAVFMIGNPGSTTRLNTVAQLTYYGQYALPYRLSFFRNLIRALDAYTAADPENPMAMDLRNTVFSLKNTEKLYGGQVHAHRDPYLMGRKVDNEMKFVSKLKASPDLRDTYMPVLERIEAIQMEKAKLGPFGALTIGLQPNSFASPSMLQRGYLATQILAGIFPAEFEEQIMGQLLGIMDDDPILERELLKSHMQFLTDVLPENGGYFEDVNWFGTDDMAVGMFQEMSALSSQESAAEFFAQDKSEWGSDPAVQYFQGFGDRLFEDSARLSELSDEEDELVTRLGRAWFAVYGTTIPPDATFSLRIQDGVVAGYEYNGTLAPAYTTFYGMFDRANSHHSDPQWELPQRWLDLEDGTGGLDLGTPVNFVSTNDIIGGNSGSPVVNIDLEIVGLAFDSNKEGMGSSTLILDDRSARSVNVDVRGMIESLRHVYKADRIVAEIEAAGQDMAGQDE